jgi:cobalamin biosynthesis protein CobD/CbiB
MEEPLPENGGDATGLIQLLLAEKRTSLAVLRTGVSVGLVPLSITTLLVTLSRFYDWLANLHFLVPMYIVLTCLTVLSLYLVGRSVRRIHTIDTHIETLRCSHPHLARWLT